MPQALVTLDPEQVMLDPPAAEPPNWAELPGWLAELARRVRDAAASGQTVTVTAAERLLTPEQMGRRMGLHRSTVVRKIDSGEIRAVMVGAHHKIPYSEYLRYREACLDRMTTAVAPEIEAELFGGR